MENIIQKTQFVDGDGKNHAIALGNIEVVTSQFDLKMGRHTPETVSLKRKRKNLDNCDSIDKTMIDAFRTQNHSLRIFASNIAAITGFHPFKNIPELVLYDHIYQGVLGKKLLHQDTTLLGINLISSDQILLDLATKVGTTTTQNAVEQALQVKHGIKTISNIETASSIKDMAIRDASKILNTNELKIFKDSIRDAVNTGFGTSLEDNALDLYQQQTGWPVEHRNAEIRVWPFGLVHETTDQVPTVHPLCSAAIGTDIDSNDDDILEIPFFSIVGSVDGIREEMAPLIRQKAMIENDDDDDSWTINQIIVECKHRMHKIYSTPPLYEQIQSITYCLMFDTTAADIVQILRSSLKPENTVQNILQDSDTSQNQNSANDKTTQIAPNSDDLNVSNEESNSSNVKIAINRVSLDDPIMQHRQNWNYFILPRLRSFCDGVYSIRRCDDKRYRLLSAIAADDQKSAWQIIFDECPWLQYCDTAFHNI